MPSKTWRQARLMAEAANDADYATKRGVPHDVAAQFHQEDLEAGIFFDAQGQLIEQPEEEA